MRASIDKITRKYERFLRLTLHFWDKSEIMKKNIWVFGLVSGIIISAMMLYSVSRCCQNPERDTNDFLGYASMIVAFSFIFIGIKNYRDKYLGGFISFGKALKVGLLIALVASTLYVAAWLVDYYLFVPEFMDKYEQHVLFQARKEGATDQELTKKAVEMTDFKNLYRNPLFVVLISYAEVLPIGVLISLISSLLLKRKEKEASQPD